MKEKKKNPCQTPLKLAFKVELGEKIKGVAKFPLPSLFLQTKSFTSYSSIPKNVH